MSYIMNDEETMKLAMTLREEIGCLIRLTGQDFGGKISDSIYKRCLFYIYTIFVGICLTYRLLRTILYVPSQVSSLKYIAGFAISSPTFIALIIYFHWLFVRGDTSTDFCTVITYGHINMGKLLGLNGNKRRTKSYKYIHNLIKLYKKRWIVACIFIISIFNIARIAAFLSNSEKSDVDMNSYLDQLFLSRPLILVMMMVSDIWVIMVCISSIGYCCFLIDIISSQSLILNKYIPKPSVVYDEDEMMLPIVDDSESLILSESIVLNNLTSTTSISSSKSESQINVVFDLILEAYKPLSRITVEFQKRLNALFTIGVTYSSATSIVMFISSYYSSGEFPDKLNLLYQFVVILALSILYVVGYKLMRTFRRTACLISGENYITIDSIPKGESIDPDFEQPKIKLVQTIIKYYFKSLQRTSVGAIIIVILSLEYLYLAFPPSCLSPESINEIHDYSKCSKLTKYVAIIERSTIAIIFYNLTPLFIGRIVFNFKPKVSEIICCVFTICCIPLLILTIMNREDFTPFVTSIVFLMNTIIYCISLYFKYNVSVKVSCIFLLFALIVTISWSIITYIIVPLYLRTKENDIQSASQQLRIMLIVVFIHPLFGFLVRRLSIQVGRLMYTDNRVRRIEVLTLFPTAMFGLIGRLLVFSVESISVIVTITAIYGCIEMSTRLTSPLPTYIIHKYFRGKTSSVAMNNAEIFRCRRSTTVIFIGDYWTEGVSIIASFLLLSIIRLAYNMKVGNLLVFVSLIVQLFGEFVSDCVSSYFMASHLDMKILRHWKYVNTKYQT